MEHHGYLYVLANSAMPGLVKVGKTNRTPSERAAELSSVTGLPSPFIVVYEQLFQDCSAAESFVHTHLAQKGFRVSDNREFFNAPANEVVRAIALAPGPIDSNSTQIVTEAEDDVRGDDEAEVTYPWSSVFHEAECYYYGHGDYLQDYAEALRLYRQAAQLGSLPAYGRIGEIYNRGEGVPQDEKKALNAYQQGAKKGSLYCYWLMGMMFVENGNKENAEKCFSSFLKKFPSFTDEQYLTSSDQTIIFMDCGSLINGKLKYGIEYPSVLNAFFNGVKAENILYHAKENEKDFRSEGAVEMADNFAKVVEYLSSPQGLPDKTSAATDISATEEKKGGFFARLFS